jgi:hypothetical protein
LIQNYKLPLIHVARDATKGAFLSTVGRLTLNAELLDLPGVIAGKVAGPIGLENEPTWWKSEKTIARTAFDAALGRELHDVIEELKRTASEIQESSDLWDLEHYLTP